MNAQVRIMILVGLILSPLYGGATQAATIMQTAQFDNETPERLYKLYLDPEHHAAACNTGAGSVSVDNKVGGELIAFKGKLKARILHLVPGQVIVLAWRNFKFDEVGPETLDSTVTLTFRANERGAEIELVQANVPDQFLKLINTHWNTLYWDRWRTYLAKNPGTASP